MTAFIVRGLDVFDAIRKRQMRELQTERDRAQQLAFEAQIAARQTAENWTDALISISRHIAELEDVDDILIYIVANGRKLLHSNFMGLALLTGDLPDLELKCYANDSQTKIVDTPVKVENPLILNTLYHAGSYCSSTHEPPASLENLCFFGEKAAKTAAIVQLDLDDKPIGTLWFARHEGEPYSETDLIWLECLADQVVIAIQHGLMTSQLQSFSIIEERGRIAREMHDGLAQVLGYLNLQVQTLETLLKRGKQDALRTELEQMRQAVQLAHADVRENILSLRTTLANEKGAILRNSDRGIYINAISPACVACQKGVGSATFFTSLQCHRDCYYCFNPNQVEYDYFQQNKTNPAQELVQIGTAGHRVDYLALTGGEPLLHKAEANAFFRTASEVFPQAHTRLYTTGDHANEVTLQELKAAGLEEIRFSIRMHDLAKGHRLTFERIALAKEYIPNVMVEMPVLPGTLAEMKDVLLELERLQIHSINLLEFCYPFTQAQAFHKRGFKVKKRPFHILYNYWYAGGVPISESELVCLDLMAFALEQQITIDVHYCSLENKLTGQNYQQNYGRSLPKTAVFSEKDYLLKSAKVFGSDISKVLNVFNRNGYRDYQRNKEHRYLEFHIDQIANLAGLDIDIGISTSTLEMRENELVVRELKVDLTRPQLFDAVRDI